VAERNPGQEESPEHEEAPDGQAPEDGAEAARPAPLDEEAAWAEIVAAYGEEPDAPAREPRPPQPQDGTRSFTVYAAGTGPRDWDAPEPSDDDLDETDDGHFVPPEPPPLPKGDTTAKFAWLAVLGGPALMLIMVIFRQPMTWWSTLIGVGGFLGGFATLIARMRPGGDEDDDLPGGGAVV
jgi:hypothetical protein